MIVVLDEFFKKKGVIEDYISLVWAERYAEYGDFVLELPMIYDGDYRIIKGYFLIIEESERVMMIEEIHPIHDEEHGSKVSVKGRSGEAILDFRVTHLVYHLVDDDIAEFINILMVTNFIDPFNGYRKFNNFVLDNILTYFDVIGTVTDQYDRQSVYTIIKNLCDSSDVGFKVYFNRTTRQLHFGLHIGVDRSYTQVDTTPYVIFSTEYDNLINSSYVESSKDSYTNVVLVTLDDPTIEYGIVSLDLFFAVPQPSGFNRRESILSSGIRRKVHGEADLTDTQINNIIKTQGYDHIVQNRIVGLFDGEIDIFSTFVYGRDFFMGDLVQFVTEGRSTSVRIVEVVITFDQSGKTSYVTLDFQGE